MTGDPSQTWDVVLRPRITPLFAYVLAAVVAATAVLAGVFMRVKSTGVVFRTSDQFGLAGVGLVVAAAMLLLARPRLRVGPAGLEVRNLLTDRLVPWNDVVDVTFPAGKRWARIEISNDEYVPVLAIQSVDRERAVSAMDSVRSAVAEYGVHR